MDTRIIFSSAGSSNVTSRLRPIGVALFAVGLGACTTPIPVEEDAGPVFITGYGVYPEGVSRTRYRYQPLVTTQMIPGIPETRFGFIYSTTGGKYKRSVHVYVIKSPPDPVTGEWDENAVWRGHLSTDLQQRKVMAWLSPHWASAYGIWTLQVYSHGELMIDKKFCVYNPDTYSEGTLPENCEGLYES